LTDQLVHVPESPTALEEVPQELDPRASVGDVVVLSAVAFAAMSTTSALAAAVGLSSVVALSLSIAMSPFVLIAFASKAVQRSARVQIDVSQAVAERRLDDARRALRQPGRLARLTLSARVQLIYAQACLAAGEGRWTDALRLYRGLQSGTIVERWKKQFLPAWVGITSAHCAAATFADELEEAEGLLDELRQLGDPGMRSRQAAIEIPLAVRLGQVDHALSILESERRAIDYATSRAGFLELAFLIEFGLRDRGGAYRSREQIDPGGISAAARRGDFDYLCTEWPELGEYLSHRRQLSREGGESFA
jgi:hypothetical protein